MKTFWRRLLVVVIVLGLVYSVILAVSAICPGPMKLKLQQGWQKLEEIHNIVPKGSIIITTCDSNLRLPGDTETMRRNGYITEGMITFYENMECISDGPVWIFYPEKYEFIIKINDFDKQCLEKLDDLNGEKNVNLNAYFGGHP